MEIINCCDLYKKKYSMEVLAANINNLLLYAILRTQHLTYDFVMNYILNEEYQSTEEEKYIDLYIVAKYQPHLNKVLFDDAE